MQRRGWGLLVVGRGGTGDPDPGPRSQHWVGIKHSGLMGMARKDTQVPLPPASRGCGSQEVKPQAEVQRLELTAQKRSRL